MCASTCAKKRRKNVIHACSKTRVRIVQDFKLNSGPPLALLKSVGAKRPRIYIALIAALGATGCEEFSFKGGLAEVELLAQAAEPTPTPTPTPTPSPTPTPTPTPAPTTSGSVDMTFGAQGVIDPLFGSTPQHGPNREFADIIRIDSQGRTLVMGRSIGNDAKTVLARLVENGSFDGNFNNGAKILLGTSTGGWGDYPCGLHPLPNGNIIITTTDGYNHFAASRLNESGWTDPSFGNNGVASIDIQSELCNSAVQPDGKILLVTYRQAPKEISITRLMPDGPIDTTFGTQGTLNIAFATHPLNRDVVVDPVSERIYVLADEVVSGANESRMIALEGSGARVSSFGNNGILALNGYCGARIALQNGSIIVAGRNVGLNALVVKRISPYGYQDYSWGPSGVAINTICSGCTEIAFDSLGRVILSGYRSNAAFGVLRLTPNGMPDTTFGNNSLATYTFGPGQASVVNSVAVQPDTRSLSAAPDCLSTPAPATLARSSRSCASGRNPTQIAAPVLKRPHGLRLCKCDSGA